MDESEDPKNNKSDRRAFMSRTMAGMTAFVAESALLSGCRRDDSTESEAKNSEKEEMEALRKTDPKLLRYREAAQWDVGFKESRGIAAGPKNGLFVVGDRAIQRRKADGTLLDEIALDGEPYCAAAGADGLFYVGMIDHIEVYDERCERIIVWEPIGGRAHLTALIAGKEIYAADAGNRVVLRYDREGRILRRIGERAMERNYPGLIAPSPHLDVALAADGSLRVSNPGMHRIETHDSEGAFLSSWGVATNKVDGFCGCCNPTDFALLPDGRFVTSEKGIPRVKIYGAKGEFLGIVAGPEAFDSRSMGIDLVVAKKDRIWALDPIRDQIRLFVPKESAA